MRAITAGAGVLAALGTALALGVSPAVFAAGAVGGGVAWAAARGTAGTAAASLWLAAAILLAAFGAPTAETAAGAVAALAAAIGLAGCLAAVIDGRTLGTLVGAWAALCVLSAGWFLVPVVAAEAAASLLGARLTWVGSGGLLLFAPAALATGATASAVGGWREAGLPPWLLTLGPAGLLVGTAVLSTPVDPDFGALAGGSVATAPVAYALLWAATTAVLASALAAAVAAAESRYRRLPAWLAAATGPAVLSAVVAVDGGVFAELALAVFPPATGPVGALAGTAPPAAVRSFVAAATVGGLALILVLPTRISLLRRATTGRPAGVGAGCLLVAVALSGGSAAGIAVAGSLAVLAWALLARPEALAPPPRTALVRAGAVAGAIAGGALVAVTLVGSVPTADPGVGGLLLLSGVVALGLSLRE